MEGRAQHRNEADQRETDKHQGVVGILTAIAAAAALDKIYTLFEMAFTEGWGGARKCPQDQIDDKIAQHGLEGHADQFKGMTKEQVKQRIKDIRDNGNSLWHPRNTSRKLWWKGDTVMIEDGTGGGTIFKPENGVQKYINQWLQRE